MFALQPADEPFFSTAPVILRETFPIGRPAGEVWQELTSDRALSWCRMIQRIDWTSPRPFGIGTTRTVRALGGANVMREHFFLWEEGRRKAFYVAEANVPLYRRFAEDYLVEPETETSCRFTWTIALDPRGPLAAGRAVNRLLLSRLFADTRRHYGA